MHIHFYANMRTTVGKSTLDLDGVSINSFRKLLSLLVEKYPETEVHLLDEHGGLRPDVPVYVDGRNPRLTQDGIDSYLKSDSVISIFSPISSGKMNVEVLRE